VLRRIFSADAGARLLGFAGAPELIGEFVHEWRNTGVDVVYGSRRLRAGESGMSRPSAIDGPFLKTGLDWAM
jgi:hypothetical protein